MLNEPTTLCASRLRYIPPEADDGCMRFALAHIKKINRLTR